MITLLPPENSTNQVDCPFSLWINPVDREIVVHDISEVCESVIPWRCFPELVVSMVQEWKEIQLVDPNGSQKCHLILPFHGLHVENPILVVFQDVSPRGRSRRLPHPNSSPRPNRRRRSLVKHLALGQ